MFATQFFGWFFCGFFDHYNYNMIDIVNNKYYNFSIVIFT